MWEDKLFNEIKLNKNEGCILFNFIICRSENDFISGGYPSINPSEAKRYFEFSYGNINFNDILLKPRCHSIILSKVLKDYEDKISKIGYPFIFKLNEQKSEMLNVKTENNNGQKINISIPLETNVSKEYPACALTFFYYPEENKFIFEADEFIKTNKKTINEVTYTTIDFVPHFWTNKNEPFECETKGDITILENLNKTDDLTFTYNQTIKLSSSAIDELNIII